jgi:hypothetical protein
VGLRVYFINAKTYHLTDVTGDGKHIGNADVKTIIDTLCGKCVLTNIPDKTKKRVCRLSAMWENAMYDIRNLAREWFHNDTDKLCSVFVDGIITPLLRECIILSKIYLQAMSLQ